MIHGQRLARHAEAAIRERLECERAGPRGSSPRRRTSAVRRPTRLASRVRSETPPSKSSRSRRAFGFGGRLPGRRERGVCSLQEEATGDEPLADQRRLDEQELTPAGGLTARVDLAGAVRPERGAQGVALGFDGPSERDGLGDLERLGDGRRRLGAASSGFSAEVGPIGESSWRTRARSASRKSWQRWHSVRRWASTRGYRSPTRLWPSCRRANAYSPSRPASIGCGARARGGRPGGGAGRRGSSGISLSH